MKKGRHSKITTITMGLLLSIGFIDRVHGQARDYSTVQCPELRCITGDGGDGADKLNAVSSDTCFLMPREDVDETMYARECYDSTKAKKKDAIKFCGFNGQNGEYAWVDEKLHYMETQRSAVGDDVITDEEKKLSQFKYKKLSAECREIIGVRKNLLPGRFCTDSYQCVSSYCKE